MSYVGINIIKIHTHIYFLSYLLYIRLDNIARKLRVSCVYYSAKSPTLQSNKKPGLFVKFDHVFCNFEDFFAELFWREHLDLVAVAEYPPGDFPQAVHAKFYGG